MASTANIPMAWMAKTPENKMITLQPRLVASDALISA